MCRGVPGGAHSRPPLPRHRLGGRDGNWIRLWHHPGERSPGTLPFHLRRGGGWALPRPVRAAAETGGAPANARTGDLGHGADGLAGVLTVHSVPTPFSAAGGFEGTHVLSALPSAWRPPDQGGCL